MDGLEKDLAQVNALGSASAERLRQHQVSPLPKDATLDAGDGHEKTLAGLAIGSAWDLISGKAETSQGRAERAQKADQYAEIAADTFSSIPKFGWVTAGVAHSVMLLDISGQKSFSAVAGNAALNFMQGAAFNKVSQMATSESAVGRMVAGRFGTGLTAEIATHAISGGGFGVVKSSLSESTWLDKHGGFSLATGLKNVGSATAVGTLIGIPAGVTGQRFGKAVTLTMGNQVERSVLASTVQKMATGAGSGFASGSVFGGVDAARSGKSLNEILHSTYEGGMIGLVTGGVSGGFDKSHNKAVSNSEHMRLGRLEEHSLAQGKYRGEGQPTITEQMVDKAHAVRERFALMDTHKRLSLNLPILDRVDEFSWRLNVKPPIVEDRTVSVLKEGAPGNYDEYMKALADMGAAGSKLDFSEHYWKPFVETKNEATRVYRVEGHSTKIVIPEEYAQGLEQVRSLRRIAQLPEGYDKLTHEQKTIVFASLRNGDAKPLFAFLPPAEVSKYIQVHQAREALKKLPLGNHALPEDLVPILDALPNRTLIKEVHLLNRRSVSDLWKTKQYESPGFRSAATVGENGIVELYQQEPGPGLYETVFHEWAHVAKWQSPPFSRLFDLASVVDVQAHHVDHQATAQARAKNPDHPWIMTERVYDPSLHSTRSQDENFAVGMGEQVMSNDPDHLTIYVDNAPVRSMILGSVLERNLLVGATGKGSKINVNLHERASYISDAARPYAIGQLQVKLAKGTPAEKAAAAILMGHLATPEQAAEMLAIAGDKANHVVPEWSETVAGEVMKPDRRTVAQHAFEAYIKLSHPGGEVKVAQRTIDARNQLAFESGLKSKNLREVASYYLQHSEDGKGIGLGKFLAMYDFPGHSAKMQELISTNFKDEPGRQRMVFDRLMDLTVHDRRTQIQIAGQYLHNPALMEAATNKLSALVHNGSTRHEREDINYSISKRMRRGGMTTDERTNFEKILAEVEKENQLQDALYRIGKNPSDRIGAIHDLTTLHDYRGIKPLLSQAVCGNPAVENEAAQALQQFNPALVKHYAQELKRESMGNPVILMRISELINSGKLTPPPPGVPPSISQLGLH